MTGAELRKLPATFTYSQARSAGLLKHRLYALRDAGEVELLGRGLYRKATAELADPDLIEAAHRSPRATMCLLSALAQHGLTDVIPSRHDLALPRGMWHPRTAGAVVWHSFDPATFDIGRTTTALDTTCSVGLYDAPRSIVDAYRMQSALGSETAHEALRRWLRQGGTPATLLVTAASFPRAEPTIRRALDVLL